MADAEVPQRTKPSTDEGASPGRGGRRNQVNLDELARRTEERDFLLASIADLDREHAAGDVDPDDYDELRRGYVARAAEAIRAVDADEATLRSQRDARPPRRGRALIWVGGVAVFTVVAGVLLANALGSRGQGAGLTGTGSMPGDQASTCRSLSMSKPAEGITCYDKVLEDQPDDVDALTYQGWAKVRSGDVEGGSAQFDRVIELDPGFADVHVFKASVLKNAGDFVGAKAELDRVYALNPSPIVTSTLEQMGLDTEIAVGLLPADVQACWKDEKAALDATVAVTSKADAEIDRSAYAGALADVALSAKCLDTVLAGRPTDADALVLRSLAVGVLGLIDGSTYDAAEADATAALAARGGDPAALLLRALWRDNLGNVEGAAADLDALGDQRVSPLVTAYVEVAPVRAQVEADRAAARSTTTTR